MLSGGGWIIADSAMKLLSQQPPCARTHACTTTTCTHTELAKIAETDHAISDGKLSTLSSSNYRRVSWMHNSDPKYQNFN